RSSHKRRTSYYPTRNTPRPQYPSNRPLRQAVQPLNSLARLCSQLPTFATSVVVNQRNNVIMKKSLQKQSGSTMIYALLTIVILSLIAAKVLVNSTTRYNVSYKQVKGWKEALYAAEAVEDVASDEV